MSKPTAEQVKAATMVVVTVGQAIRELGSVPNGHLYARLMGHLSLDSYNAVIETLKKAGVVKEENNVLTYIGPKAKEG